MLRCPYTRYSVTVRGRQGLTYLLKDEREIIINICIDLKCLDAKDGFQME